MVVSNAALQVLQLPFLARLMGLLLQELAQPEPRLGVVNALLGHDPALTALILQRVNADHPGETSCTAMALGQLSCAEIVQTLRSTTAFPYTRKPEQGFDLMGWCQYSVQVARITRSLAGGLHLDARSAYTAGLLHAVGMLPMHRQLIVAGQAKTSSPVLDWGHWLVEKKVLGYSAAALSAHMARQWQLPALLVQCIADHEEPFVQGNFEPLSSVLHLAVWRVRTEQSRRRDALRASTYPAEVALALGLDMDMVLQRDPFDWMQQAGEGGAPG
ncbi:HD-like signal output (HDOD) protein [Corticibacter populi]|nr:HD-like signal output (HDOD) protein [Corticibacter populi]